MPQISEYTDGLNTEDESPQHIYYLTDVFPHLSRFALDVDVFNPRPQVVTEELNVVPTVDHSNEEANNHPSTLPRHSSALSTCQVHEDPTQPPQTFTTPSHLTCSSPSSSPRSNSFLSFTHRNTPHLPTAASNSNTYKYRAMPSSSVYPSTKLLASDTVFRSSSLECQTNTSDSSNNLSCTTPPTGAAIPIAIPSGKEPEQEAAEERPLWSPVDPPKPPLDSARCREASIFGSPAAPASEAFGSPSPVRNAIKTSSLLLRRESISGPSSVFGSPLGASQPLGISGPSRPRPTELYQTPPRRNIPYLLPIITSGPGFHPGSQGQASPSPVSGQGSALSALSPPISPAPVRKLTVRNRGPEDSFDSTPARLSPTSALTPARLSPASVNSSVVSFGNFTRQTSPSNGNSRPLHGYEAYNSASLSPSVAQGLAPYTYLFATPSRGPSVLDDESPILGSPPAGGAASLSLLGFSFHPPPRLNAMPLSDPAPDNMAHYTSPRLNINNMVTANKSTFDNILAAWTCHPEREEIRGCDMILHRLGELEMDWSIVQGKLEEEIRCMPAETLGAVQLPDSVVEEDEEEAAQDTGSKDVKGKGRERMAGIFTPTQGLRRALSSIFSSPGKKALPVSPRKEGRSLRHRVSEHFRRGSSSKPDGKGKEKEVKVVQPPLLWMDQMSLDIVEGLRRVQDLKEVVEAVQKSRAAL